MTITDDELKAMAVELCLLRGEQPNSVDRGGVERWERYKPLAEGALREAERLFALRQSSPPDGQTADGWIEWKGGECPVSPDTEVYWRRRSEEGKPTADMEREFKPAAYLRWSHRSASSDIIAYRVIPTPSSETKAPGEEH